MILSMLLTYDIVKIFVVTVHQYKNIWLGNMELTHCQLQPFVQIKQRVKKRFESNVFVLKINYSMFPHNTNKYLFFCFDIKQ